MAGPLTRRRLLGTIGGVGGTVLAAGWAPVAFSQTPTATKQQRQWAMVIDLRRCERCTSACQETHHLPQNFEWIKVFEVKDKSGAVFSMPRPCFQCENAPCLRVCPVAATYRASDGVVLVDQDRCIGCRMCMAACP